MQEVLNEMRRDYSTSRGSQSLDGEALEKVKQQLKQAQKKGFSSIIERFDNDVDFTLHSVAGGFDRELLAIEDVLTHSALPNLGRSQEQRTLGVGAHGGGQQAEMARNEAIARILLLRKIVRNLQLHSKAHKLPSSLPARVVKGRQGLILKPTRSR